MADSADFDWFIQEWAALRGKRQADLVKDLGWAKNHAHRIWHGKQPYRRDIVNQVCAWLGIEPYELMMRPADAMRLRQLREAAFAIAANEGSGPEVAGTEFGSGPASSSQPPLRRKAS